MAESEQVRVGVLGCKERERTRSALSIPQIRQDGEPDPFTCSGRGRARCLRGPAHHGVGAAAGTGGRAGPAAGKA